MSSWPLTYNYHNPHPQLPTHNLSHMSIDKLWDLLICHFEIFITYHVYITTTHHFLSLSYYLLNGTLRNRGDLSYRDAATLHWIYRQGENSDKNWQSAILFWTEAILEEQREYERVRHSSLTHLPHSKQKQNRFS